MLPVVSGADVCLVDEPGQGSLREDAEVLLPEGLEERGDFAAGVVRVGVGDKEVEAACWDTHWTRTRGAEARSGSGSNARSQVPMALRKEI